MKRVRPMGCLDEERVFGLVSGTLASVELEAARAHLGECGPCRVLVAETAKSVESSASIPVDVEETSIEAHSRGKIGVAEGSLAPGTVIDGKYRVEGTIGRGGMGTVLAAVHVQLKLEVAIKVLRTSMMSRRDVVGRFMREARAAARIKSPYVVGVLDVGSLPNGAPYIVMERLHGNDLSAEIATRGRLPTQEAVDYAIEVCEALAEAHATGVVHRDLKPANVFLCKADGAAPHVKVLDFGISKISDRGSDSAPDFSTEIQSWLGTPRYMAPEQITLGRKVDERADIWAIGTILYELISGHPPFQDKTLEVLCKRLLEEPPPSLADESADRLPRGLEAIVVHCLQKTPDKRYGNVAMLARALAPYGSGSKEVSLQRIAALPGMAPDPSESRTRPLHSGRTRRILLIGAAAIAVASAAFLVVRQEFLAASPGAASAPSEAPSATASEPTVPTTASAPPVEAVGEHTPVAPTSGPGRRSTPRATSPASSVKHPEFGGRL